MFERGAGFSAGVDADDEDVELPEDEPRSRIPDAGGDEGWSDEGGGVIGPAAACARK